jgi:hypothetical protein
VAHDPRFDSAWYKWLGAIVHAQTLQDDINATGLSGDADPVRAFRTEYDAKRHGFRVIVEDLAPMELRWCLLVGDIANNFRASLDHLAWAITLRGRTPPGSGRLSKSQENGVYFPIAQHRSDFNADVDPRARRPKLPGVGRADRAKVRRRQPYHRAAKNRPRHPFSLLASINNRDKHRTIEPVWTFPTRVDTEITDMRDCLVRPPAHVRRSAEPLEVGAEIAFVRARKTGPNPELEMKLQVAAEPALDQRVSVRHWHGLTGMMIFDLLREFSVQPPGMDKIVEGIFTRPG